MPFHASKGATPHRSIRVATAQSPAVLQPSTDRNTTTEGCFQAFPHATTALSKSLLRGTASRTRTQGRASFLSSIRSTSQSSQSPTSWKSPGRRNVASTTQLNRRFFSWMRSINMCGVWMRASPPYATSYLSLSGTFASTKARPSLTSNGAVARGAAPQRSQSHFRQSSQPRLPLLLMTWALAAARSLGARKPAAAALFAASAGASLVSISAVGSGSAICSCGVAASPDFTAHVAEVYDGSARHTR
mmetsp:Transcript_4574/g.13052  ORF Transcript_4574/g.13052 Transcript_4574/m.13052 type:complete len:246 (-) Transcript_4574:35-772(-)